MSETDMANGEIPAIAVANIEVRAAKPTDWRVAKDVRLRALADSPSAFGSTLARETLFDDAEWQQRVSSGAWFLAWAGTEAVGMAATIDQDCLPDERHLVGMWVAPERRGSPVAAQLVEAASDAAQAAGASGVVLWWPTTTPSRPSASRGRAGRRPAARNEN